MARNLDHERRERHARLDPEKLRVVLGGQEWHLTGKVPVSLLQRWAGMSELPEQDAYAALLASVASVVREDERDRFLEVVERDPEIEMADLNLLFEVAVEVSTARPTSAPSPSTSSPQTSGSSTDSTDGSVSPAEAPTISFPISEGS